MSRDSRLPQTDEELRDWLAEAWKDGWRSRRRLIGRPAGTVEHRRPQMLDKFLTDWDLPPMPKPSVDPDSLRKAIQRMAAMEGGE